MTTKIEETAAEQGKAKHTPGPWRAAGNGIIADGWGTKGAIVVPAGIITHRNLHTGQINNLKAEANARLIAAAPALLAALEACITERGARCFQYSAADTSADRIRAYERRLEHITEQARAAIAAAKGESL